MNPDLKTRLENILSEPIKSTSSVSGGCIADSRNCSLSPERSSFLNSYVAAVQERLKLRSMGLKSFVNQVP